MKIALYGQYYKDNTEDIIEKVLRVFDRYAPQVLIEANFYTVLNEKGLLPKPFDTFSEHEELQEGIDLFISIGGDGTMLRAATLVRDKNIPIVGINAGRLGFLATVQQENIEALLPQIFTGGYKISSRSLLSLDYQGMSPEDSALDFALNEVTVSRKDTTSMITIDVKLNGDHLNSYWADGLIISTPTGSTGYSLSCGGPVLMPDVTSLVITPIAPHNLNARPLVIPDDTDIELRVSSREEQHLVSLDSRIISVNVETVLRLKKAGFTIKLVEFPQEKFLDTLRKKLLWGEDKRN
ncbi:inorganic polyphosphate kinase [Flavobacterium akiainvivens]|uniref:NAD kinase n=1 Tax=Flavobacterium akiainvivens TaxID=1202724 RepID=A0A0M9VJ71_9FLAO|nr:NAD kinase [Flavobacterium akiainvivens]KOS07452.1 inorganic polyphosphate kinase [Flavobacterium akiainvivens]SFQ63071.1 NAD+ kinase [Flavobacterium akiainvivens]